MSTTSNTHNLIAVIATSAALLAIALTGTAGAAANPLAQERYPSDKARQAALAQERYYSSYGEPEPLSLPSAPAPSDGTPWLPIVAVAGGALALALTAAGARRLSVRRRTRRALA